MEDMNTIECPHCGAQANVMDTRCPKCGRSFYPEDEPGPDRWSTEPQKRDGLAQHLITMAVIGGLAGGGITIIAGAEWAWLIPVGALLLGLVSWILAKKT